jgi:hypothetical protein
MRLLWKLPPSGKLVSCSLRLWPEKESPLRPDRSIGPGNSISPVISVVK